MPTNKLRVKLSARKRHSAWQRQQHNQRRINTARDVVTENEVELKNLSRPFQQSDNTFSSVNLLLLL